MLGRRGGHLFSKGEKVKCPKFIFSSEGDEVLFMVGDEGF